MPDLESVIANAVNEARDSGVQDEVLGEQLPDADSGDETPAEPTAPAADDPAPAAEADAAADAAVPAAKTDAEKKTPAADASADDIDTIPERDATGRINRIPHTRVKAIVATGVKKAEAAWEAAKLKPVAEKVTAYEQRLERVGAVEKIMFEDQPRFLEILKTIPGYSELLGGTAAKPAAAATPAVDPADEFKEPMPAPDGDGGYTPEGLQALLDWTTRRATHNAVRETEKRLGARIKPFEERDAAARANHEMAQKTWSLIDQATAEWEGFKEHASEILDVLKQDTAGRLSLQDAYRQVVIPKFKADRQRVREEVLKELEKAPRSTAAGGTGAVSRVAAAAAAAAGPRDLEDVIRESLRPLRRQ